MIVGQAYNDERYVIVTGYSDSLLKVEALFDNDLGDLAKLWNMLTQLVDTSDNLITRIAAKDAIRSED